MSIARALVAACLMFALAHASHAWTEAEINAGKKELQENFFSGNQTLVIASKKTRDEVVAFARDFMRKNNITPEGPLFDVFESDNGWYAVTLGIEPAQDCQ